MKNLLLLLLAAPALDVGAQTLDLGLDFQFNRNILSNRFQNSGDINASNFVGYTFDGSNFVWNTPERNLGFMNDDGLPVYVRFDRSVMQNSFEIPLYMRYTTSNNWFFDFSISGGTYKLEYEGRLILDEQYYLQKNLPFEGFQTF